MYEPFYKLSGKPFSLTPDPRFYFESSGHKRAMAYLRYGLEQREGFIVITGGIGTGKTTLVEMLFRLIEREKLTAAKIVTTQLDADDLLRMVGASFGLPHDQLSKAGVLKALEAFFQDKARQQERVLLVVDEAQNIPKRALEELRMLSNILVDGLPVLQTFLLGQDEFIATLQAPDMEQLRQRVIATYRLKPLDKDETRAYIEHRLKQVGWRGDPSLEDGAYEAIFLHTGGVPRRVNTFCDRLMLYGFLEELHAFNADTVQAVIAELTDELDRTRVLPTLVAEQGAGGQPEIARRITELEERMNELEDAMILERARLRAIYVSKK